MLKRILKIFIIVFLISNSLYCENNKSSNQNYKSIDELKCLSTVVADNELFNANESNQKDLIKLTDGFFVHISINIITVLIILLLVYYPRNKKIDYLFSFFVFNIIIFLITYVLNEVKISLGAAFGLFAVFSMLRYRTSGVSMKEMTYLFLFIAIGLLSAIKLEFYELIIINSIIVIVTFVFDSKYILKPEVSRYIIYDNIELLKPENNKLLIEDIKLRTGLNVTRVNIHDIDFVKSSAKILIYFSDNQYTKL